MFPIRSDVKRRSTPYVTIGLIAANILVFVIHYTRSGNEPEVTTWRFGFIPAEFVLTPNEFNEGLKNHPPTKQATDQLGRPLFLPGGRPLQMVDVDSFKAAQEYSGALNIFTCMFLHGGWMHLLGNMFFLWIFGSSIEDRLGSALYPILYFATGVCGNLLHTFIEPSFTPLVGASGAISGVMGAYLVLYPRVRILAYVPIGLYPATFSLPAWVYLAFYFVLQNLFPAIGGTRSNVAFWAHIGGFVSGVILIFVLPKRPPAPVENVYDPARDDADFVI